MLLKLVRIAALTVLVLGLKLLPVYAAQSDESSLKAVFVLNFAKLTEWPAGSTPGKNTY